MADATWYLGPLGDLRAVSCPESGVSMTQQRFGGVHQGLTGARVVDVTGTRMAYDFEFKWLEQDEWGWLDALNTRLVPGPFYLIDPFKKNRLSIQSTNMRKPFTEYIPGENYAFKYSFSRDLPAGLPYSARSAYLYDWVSTQTAVNVRFTPSGFTPIFPGETITGSVFAKANTAGAAGTLFFQYYDIDGNVLVTVAENLVLQNVWQRFKITRTPTVVNSKQVHAVRMSYQTNSRTPIYLAAPQLESGANPTTWEPGGGAPKVLMDQLETTSPRFPLRDCAMTLLEA